MTNLEWLKKTMISKDNELRLCAILYKMENKRLCNNINCYDCLFRRAENIINYLSEEHRTSKKYRLTESEYRVIRILKNGNFPLTILKEDILKKIDYKEDQDDVAQMEDVLNNCEIVTNDDEF